MDFNSNEAKEIMRLSMMAYEALKRTMILRGIPIVRINYMEAGNWVTKYIHIYD